MKRSILHLAVRIAAVVLLLASMVVVLGPVRTELARRFEIERDQLVTQLETIIGRKISYSRISPSILRFLSVHDLTIHGTADEPADLLTVGRVRIYYRPIRLLQRRYAEAFSEIRIENTTLSIDTRHGSSLNALVADILGAGDDAVGGTNLTEILPDDLIISGRNIDLWLRSNIGLLEMDRLFFSTSLAEETVDVRFQGDMRLSETPEGFPFTDVSGRVNASGTINVITGGTLLELSLPVLSSDVATLRKQVLQVRFADGVFEARNVQNQDPIDLYARYIDETGELYARILADGYRLIDLFQLEGEYAAFNDYLALPVKGQASATLTPDSLSFGGSLLTELVGFDQIPDGELTLQFDGDTTGVQIDRLTYATALGTASYRGALLLDPLRPDGVLTLRDMTYGGIDPLSLVATLRSGPQAIDIATERFSYAGTLFRSLSGTVSLGESPATRFTVEIGDTDDSRLEVETVHEADGKLRSARIDARGMEPARLTQIQEALLPDLAVPDLSILPGAMVVDTRLRVDLSDGLLIDVPLFYAFDADQPDDYLSFSLAYDDGSVDIRDLTVSYQGYDGSGDFTAQIESDGAITFASDVVVEQIPYEFSGRLEPDNSLSITGLYDVEAEFFFGERDEIVFRGSADLPLPSGDGKEGRLVFAADGFYFSPDDWVVNLDRLVASGIPFASIASPRLELEGTLSPSGARLISVGYSDEYSSLAGSANVDWDLDAFEGSADLSLSTTAEATEAMESYEISASYIDGLIDGTATVEQTPLLRFGVETIRGSVSGTASIAGPPDAFVANVDARLVDGKFNNDPVDLAAVVEYGPQAIRVVDGSARYIRTRADDVVGTLSFADGSLQLAGVIAQSGENGGFSVELDATGVFDRIGGPEDVVASDFAGKLRLFGLPEQDNLPSTWEFAIDRSGRTTRATGGPEDAVAITFSEDGSFEGSIGQPMPIHFDAVGLFEGGSIEADLTNVWGDGARLWSIIGQPGFGFTGGTATGSLRIVGPLNDPDFYGTLIAEGVTARVDMIPDELGPGRSFIVFDEKTFTVREASVPVGDARATVAMEALLDRWGLEEFRVTITTEEQSAVRITNDFGGVAVDGTAAGTIVVSGGRAVTRISGDVTASSTTITLSEAGEPSPPGEDQGDLGVDITVRAGRGVQFLWPSNVFPILRGFADAGEAIRITYDSATTSYSVAGGIDIQGGEVFYFDRSFYIRQGRITFDEDEQEFDPLLTVNAEIREVADEGPVRIYLVADERPLSEFTPQWRSDPPMSEASILALLGGSVFVSEAGTPIGLSDAVLLTSDVVSQFGIIRGFESTVRETLQLDLFSIRTQLFQNLLRGVIAPDEEYPLDNTVPSLGQYLDNTTLFMGKYLGTDLFLELLVQFRAAEPSALEPRSLAGIEVDSEIGLEWRTPFFLLEWGFFPRDPSSLFLADNTISFTWDYSY